MISPKISIVIPSYNKVRFIGKTLDSIFSQEYPNLEVIIEDGNSDDGTLKIIKEYANKYKSIKWESKKDKGQLDAINKGLKKAKGDIATFINADDIYAKNSFSDVSDTYRNNPDALWFAGRGTVINGEGKEIAGIVTWYKSLLLSLNHKSLILILDYLMQPSVFLTKKAYLKYGPFTGTNDFVTEYDLWLRLANVRMPIIIDKTLSRFRIEPSTKTKTMFKSLLAEDKKIVKKYTANLLILFLHDLHNLGRTVIGTFI